MSSLTAFYDLQFGPVSFDFVTWLIRAKLEAGERGLHVAIVPKEDGLCGIARHWGKHDEAATRWRLWHIVIPSCQLVGATVTLCDSRFRSAEMNHGDVWWPQGASHFLGPLVDAAKSGAVIPKLKASEQARRYVKSWLGEKVVTLTLRNQSTGPERNSDADAWHGMSVHLRSRGYNPFVLDDTHVAMNRGVAHAELDIDLRMAVYEQAVMNLSCATGPDSLLKFSDAPYLNFNQGMAGWEEHYRKHLHLQVGDQLPWARSDQRLIYKPDTLDVMVEEFDKWARATN